MSGVSFVRRVTVIDSDSGATLCKLYGMLDRIIAQLSGLYRTVRVARHDDDCVTVEVN